MLYLLYRPRYFLKAVRNYLTSNKTKVAAHKQSTSCIINSFSCGPIFLRSSNLIFLVVSVADFSFVNVLIDLVWRTVLPAISPESTSHFRLLGLLLTALTLAEHGVHGTDQCHACYRCADVTQATTAAAAAAAAKMLITGHAQRRSTMLLLTLPSSKHLLYDVVIIPHACCCRQPTLNANITSFCVIQLSTDNQLTSLIGIIHTRDQELSDSRYPVSYTHLTLPTKRIV